MADRIEIDQAAIRAMGLPGSETHRHMMRLGHEVEVVAKTLVKVDTGHLRDRLHTEAVVHRGVAGARVGDNSPVAHWTHEGTGLWGPSGAPITPRRAPRLVFFWKKRGHWMRVKSVRGQPGAHYLTRALRAVFRA